MVKDYFQDFTAEDVYKLYKWYKQELKNYFGNLDTDTWSKLTHFFKTKQQPNETFHKLLSFFPEEDHIIIISRIRNIDQTKLEVLEILDTFDYGNDKHLKKIFTIQGVRNNPKELEIIAHAVYNQEIEFLLQFYQKANKETVKKLYNWFTKASLPYLLMIVLVTYPTNYPLLLSWCAPWYFQLTKKVLWFVEDELKGLTVNEFLNN